MPDLPFLNAFQSVLLPAEPEDYACFGASGCNPDDAALLRDAIRAMADPLPAETTSALADLPEVA